MKKSFQIAVVIFLSTIVFLSVVYYQINLRNIYQHYQAKIESLNQKIAELEKQIATKQPEEKSIRGWNIYEDKDHVFSFMYPAEWKDSGRKIEITNSFIKNPQIGVLQLELLKQNQSLVEIAKNEIKKRSCLTDHIIENNVSGLMYVTYCGDSTEMYNYIFKTNQGETIKLSYHEDFDSDWYQEKKLEKFRAIIATISLSQL